MTKQQMFVRKISYFVAIGVLLFPLYLLGMPGTQHSDGGKLAELRKEHRLHRADLGQVDPTSPTMKMLTFGLDGIAVNLLWNTAINAKEREDWTTYSAAAKQIENLQPHSVEVWKFQAHNVAYNISIEFDDWRDRYRYVMKGIDMLTEGIRNNERDPYLVREEARFIGFKIGKSDESELFRPMFRRDDEYHQRDNMKGTRYVGRPETLRDNWQVSKWWYAEADKLFNTGAASYGKQSTAVIHSDAPHSQIEYAKALEDDGHFGKIAADAWTEAARDWKQFGEKALRTSDGLHVRLLTYDDQLKETEALKQQFTKLLDQEPGLEERLIAQRRAALLDVEREALDMPAGQRTDQQQLVAGQAARKMVLSYRDKAAAVAPERRAEALTLADRLAAASYRLDMLQKYREIVNYEYWRLRCEVECLPDTFEARREIHDGDRALKASKLKDALDHYNRGLAKWQKVIDQNNLMLSDKTMVMELMQIVEQYEKIRKQNNDETPEPAVVKQVRARYDDFTKRE